MSNLSDLAASLGEREWGELSVTGMETSLNTSGGSPSDGTIMIYGSKIAWDSVGHAGFLIGSDHSPSFNSAQLVKFTESTSVYARLSKPSWLSGVTFYHGYEHTSFDSVNRRLWSREAFAENMRYWDVDTDPSTTWTTVAGNPIGSNGENTTEGCEYFPTYGSGGSMIWPHSGFGTPHGNIMRYNAGAWTVPHEDIDMRGSYCICRYNPFLDKMFLYSNGSSGEGDVMFHLDAAGSLVSLGAPTQSLYDGSGIVGNVCPDPVSGEYVVLTAGSRASYTINPTTGAFTSLSTTGKPSISTNSVWSCPVPEYGVILYAIAAQGGGAFSTWVYKHTASGESSASKLAMVSL